MILFFSDTHLGLRSHSIQDSNGIYSAELDAMKALDYVFERGKKDDVDTIIFGGDMNHTNHPTPLNVQFLVEWFLKIDSLNKPVYIIPGNHDTSMYYHGMIFGSKLKLKNIKFIYEENHKFNWNDWNVKFIPYVPNKSLKDKDALVNKELEMAISSARDRTIIVSHIQEYSSRIGSESRMLSRGVYLLDADIFKDRKFLFLLGHIHTAQNYIKGNVSVIYPGSTSYMDATDIGIKKGFCLIDKDGNPYFEEIPGIRKFLRYSVPDGIDPLEFFKSSRILLGSVIFIDHLFEEKLNTTEIYKFFKDRECLIGSIKKRDVRQNADSESIFINTRKSSYDIFRDYVNNYKTDVDKEKILSYGIKRIESYAEMNKDT